MNFIRAVLVGLCLLAGAVFAGPAAADVAVFNLDTYVGANGSPPAGPYGTVTLTQYSLGVNVTLDLLADVQGVTMKGADGPDVLLFDLAGFPGTIPTIDILTPGFTLDEATVNKKGVVNYINSKDTGDWLYGIQCISPCHGGDPIPGPLSFLVEGATIADFIRNDQSNYFSADLCIGTKRNGNCMAAGDVLGNSDPTFMAPEPASIAMLGFGLLGFGGLALLRRRKALARR